jgi:hypothetical protein
MLSNCTFVGFTRCDDSGFIQIGSVTPFDLTLDQSGNSVTGLFRGILPVTGAVSPDGTLVLEGSKSLLGSGNTSVKRLASWSAKIDASGRLQGSFVYVEEVFWNPGVNGGGVYTRTYTYDLQSVLLVPWE